MNETGASAAIRALNLVPIVVEQTARGERAYDIYSRLLKGLHRQPGGGATAVPRG